jgi:hypothetical protein
MQKEKQLTTVEWFVMELRKLIKESELSDMRPSEFDTKEMMLIDQAKEMEKEQIMNAFEAAEKDCGKDFLHGDLYYNETFKSE